ncbi:MAG: polysaccharide deacetylase family protein [Solirubrobacteraceae bacterium]
MILDALRLTGTPATFFAIGARAARYPDLLRRIASEGHEIGNHTWSHRPLAWGTWPSPRVELERTLALNSAALCALARNRRSRWVWITLMRMRGKRPASSSRSVASSSRVSAIVLADTVAVRSV